MCGSSCLYLSKVLSFVFNIVNKFGCSLSNVALRFKVNTEVYVVLKIFYGFSNIYSFEEFNEVSELVTEAIRSKVDTSLERREIDNLKWGKWSVRNSNVRYVKDCNFSAVRKCTVLQLAKDPGAVPEWKTNKFPKNATRSNTNATWRLDKIHLWM